LEIKGLKPIKLGPKEVTFSIFVGLYVYYVMVRCLGLKLYAVFVLYATRVKCAGKIDQQRN